MTAQDKLARQSLPTEDNQMILLVQQKGAKFV
jgi:hypothetical protein